MPPEKLAPKKQRKLNDADPVQEEDATAAEAESVREAIRKLTNGAVAVPRPHAEKDPKCYDAMELAPGEPRTRQPRQARFGGMKAGAAAQDDIVQMPQPRWVARARVS
ncbi:MAG TPA: hypothetical protein VMB71_06845 [Acetobacteraceae bacterium]|nr:hypothetical protein [Acetobacteraceae bacterium]